MTPPTVFNFIPEIFFKVIVNWRKLVEWNIEKIKVNVLFGNVYSICRSLEKWSNLAVTRYAG